MANTKGKVHPSAEVLHNASKAPTGATTVEDMDDYFRSFTTSGAQGKPSKYVEQKPKLPGTPKK